MIKLFDPINIILFLILHGYLEKKSFIYFKNFFILEHLVVNNFIISGAIYYI